MILAHIRLIEMSHCHSYHDIFYNYFMMSFLVFVSLSMTWCCTRDRFIVAHFVALQTSVLISQKSTFTVFNVCLVNFT